MYSQPFDSGVFALPVGAAAWTVLLTQITNGHGLLALIEGANAGANPLTDFLMELQNYPGGNWYPFLTGTDWETAGFNLPFTTKNVGAGTLGLNACAAAGYAAAHVRINHAYAFRLSGKSVAGTASFRVRGIVRESNAGMGY